MVEGPTQDDQGAGRAPHSAARISPPQSEDVTSAKATSPQRRRWPPVTTCQGDRSGTDPAQPPVLESGHPGPFWMSRITNDNAEKGAFRLLSSARLGINKAITLFTGHLSFM